MSKKLPYRTNHLSITNANIQQQYFDDQFSVFPNPSKESLNIISKQANSEIYELEFYHINGNLIYAKQFSDKIVLPLESLSSGIYFLKLETNNKVLSKKIIVSE